LCRFAPGWNQFQDPIVFDHQASRRILRKDRKRVTQPQAGHGQ
jgi:hypothetical protein